MLDFESQRLTVRGQPLERTAGLSRTESTNLGTLYFCKRVEISMGNMLLELLSEEFQTRFSTTLL